MSRVEEPKEQEGPPELPELETLRLKLRELSMDDLKGFYELLKDPEIVDYSGQPPRETIEEARARIEERLEKRLGYGPTRYSWAVEEKETGRYLGEVTLHSVDSKHKRGELAFGLIDEARGKGYGTESGRGVIDFAFDTLGLIRVQAATRTTNERAQRTLESLGFSREGTLRDYWVIDGKPGTVHMYSLLRKEYQKETA